MATGKVGMARNIEVTGILNGKLFLETEKL